MKRLWWVSALCLFWGSCAQKEVSVSYHLDAPLSVEIFHNGVFSTFDGPDEIVGTMTATYTEARYQRQADSSWSMVRTLIGDKSNGYHKHSLPMELSWRLPEVRVTTDPGRAERVRSVEGYSAFATVVVEKLPIKRKFKRQLLDARMPVEFEAYEMRRWRLNHLIGNDPVPADGNITEILRRQGRLPLEGIAVDSVVADGFRRLDGRRCFEYAVYFSEPEPFPYFLWEQHAYGTRGGQAVREYRADSARYATRYTVAIDSHNGIPCQEREVKTAVFYLTHPRTGESAQFRANVTLEHLYTVKK